MWSNPQAYAEWHVSKSLLQTGMEERDIHTIRMAISHARDVVLDEPYLRPDCEDMERRVANMESRAIAQRAPLLWEPQVVQQLDRFWDVTAFDMLRTESRSARGRWGRVHSLLVSNRGTVTQAGYCKLHVRINRLMHDDPDHWDHSLALEHSTDDWLDDVARFGGQGALNAWFSRVKGLSLIHI